MTRDEFLKEIESRLSDKQFTRNGDMFELVNYREQQSSMVVVNGKTMRSPGKTICIKFKLIALGDGWICNVADEEEKIPLEWFEYVITMDDEIKSKTSFMLYYDEPDDIFNIIR